jgi:hypothetical protein
VRGTGEFDAFDDVDDVWIDLAPSGAAIDCALERGDTGDETELRVRE